MNNNLLNAILSMDAYNRGYSQGIILPTGLGGESKIANHHLEFDSFNEVIRKLPGIILCELILIISCFIEG